MFRAACRKRHHRPSASSAHHLQETVRFDFISTSRMSEEVAAVTAVRQVNQVNAASPARHAPATPALGLGLAPESSQHCTHFEQLRHELFKVDFLPVIQAKPLDQEPGSFIRQPVRKEQHCCLCFLYCTFKDSNKINPLETSNNCRYNMK